MADTIIDAVAAIAADAGALALRRFRTAVRQWEKAPGQLVCDVDLEVDAMLRERLSALLPDAGWLSEETVDRPDRLAADRLWVVDPIDGTRDYLRGRPGWAVSIALVDRGRPVLGILEAPARGEHWRAAVGQGAFRDSQRLRSSTRSELAGARIPADALPKADRDFEMVAKPNSIALRIAMVAAGEADLVATTRWGNEWDLAAAAVIAEEAGAAVSDAFGQPLAFNTPDARAFGLLVTAPGIRDAAVAHLRERAEHAHAR